MGRNRIATRPQMQVVTGYRAALSDRRVVAIGNFDGLHLGHQRVLDALAGLGASLGAEPWVYTFDPAPTAILAPERHQPRLLGLDRKLQLFESMGLRGVVVEPFTPDFAQMNAGQFAHDVLDQALGAVGVVVGWDFRFGAGRGGDAAALRAEMAVPVIAVEAEVCGELPVSSSRIRKLLASGDVIGAANLLGRPHRLEGTVVHGDARGRMIGFPTANLELALPQIVPDGVYAARIGAIGAVVNLGHRPTFAGVAHRVEAHLLGFEGDLYGRRLAVDLLARLRDERRFSGPEALVAQIGEDIARARGVLGA